MKNLKKDFEDNYISKKTFDTGLKEDSGFNFKILVEVVSLMAACGEKGYSIYVNAVKLPEFLSAEQKKEVASCMCIDEREISLMDIQSYGLYAPFENHHVITRKEVAEALKKIDDNIPVMGGMCGFYFDKTYNMIGNTGWDFINGEIGFKKAI